MAKLVDKDGVDRPSKTNDDPFSLICDWLESTLTCTAFAWDLDQHAAATESLQLARDKLKANAHETNEARPRSEWHDDTGDVLWWHFPIEEAPYAGSPLDSHWEEHELDGHFTHWTPIPIPSGPVQKAFDRCAHGNVANECPHPHTDIR